MIATNVRSLPRGDSQCPYTMMDGSVNVSITSGFDFTALTMVVPFRLDDR